jgi:hypothetical protein
MLNSTNFYLIICVIFIASCTTSSSKKTIQNNGDCYITNFNLDNINNDTSKIKIIKTAVFDTTAILLHGYVVDSLFNPIEKTEITFYKENKIIKQLTNSNGEFKIFQNLDKGSWNLLVKKTDYECLNVLDIVKAGGQWFYIKLKKI